MNPKALFNMTYGMFLLTTREEGKDYGCIINTAVQVARDPERIAISVQNNNKTCEVLKRTELFNLSALTTDAPFDLFRNFGFRTGRTEDKFAGVEELRSDNGLRFLPRHINSFMSLQVDSYVDLETHGMFICSVTEARVISDKETMSYTFYLNQVKPKPETAGKKGHVCKICGWVYEGEELPADIICPLCKHGAADFEPV